MYKFQLTPSILKYNNNVISQKTLPQADIKLLQERTSVL